MAKCKICEGVDDLVKARDEDGNIVSICENCYESVCEGYERVDEKTKEGGVNYGCC